MRDISFFAPDREQDKGHDSYYIVSDIRESKMWPMDGRDFTNTSKWVQCMQM